MIRVDKERTQANNTPFLYEVASTDGSEYFVNGSIRRQRTIEDIELSLQALWDVVSTTLNKVVNINMIINCLWTKKCRQWQY